MASFAANAYFLLHKLGSAWRPLTDHEQAAFARVSDGWEADGERCVGYAIGFRSLRW